MTTGDWKIGDRFAMPAGDVWQVTDVGSRVIVAIRRRAGWTAGPPYALAETVFDEDDQPDMTRVEGGVQ